MSVMFFTFWDNQTLYAFTKHITVTETQYLSDLSIVEKFTLKGFPRPPHSHTYRHIHGFSSVPQLVSLLEPVEDLYI